MRRALSTTALVIVVALGAVIVLGLATMGGGSSTAAAPGELFAITQGGFDITVPASGHLRAANQVMVRNELESGAVITELVPEGKIVSEGDILMRLNDEAILDGIRNAEFNLTQAQSDFENVRTNLEILRKKRDSELATKQLAIDLADLALQSWREGEVVAERLKLRLAIETAQKNHERLKHKYESSLRLFEQKFISKDELDQDEIALLNADAALKRADLDSEVYEQYTYRQDKQIKESDLRQARDEMERAVARLASELRGTESSLANYEKRLANRTESLDNLRRQLELCTVVAPSEGMVIYATSMGDREGDEELKVGRTLYRNELVLLIPDMSKMVASVKVNEALSGLIAEGQRASITCDAFPDSTLSGTVSFVGVLAEGGGWRDPSRRDYTMKIDIDDGHDMGLKPSMRCTADIEVGRVDDALFVPIHAIHRTADTAWVWRRDGGGFAQHPVTVGQFSERYVVIEAGLADGDEVLLREPAPSQVTSRLDQPS